MRTAAKSLVGLLAGAVWAFALPARAENRVRESLPGLASDVSKEVVWKAQAWLLPSVSGNGEIVYDKSDDDWYDDGTSLALQAVPSQYHAFAGWSGQTNTTANPLEVVIDKPYTNLFATFAPLVSSMGTPYEWYAGYGITEHLDVADEVDHDEDDFVGRQEYIWGTNPNQRESYPRIVVESRSGDFRVIFPETSGRAIYSVQQRENLHESDWQTMTNAQGNDGSLSFVVEQDEIRKRFYRGSAELSGE